MAVALILTDVRIDGALTIAEDGISPQQRTSILKQTPNAEFPIRLDSLRVWDAYHTNLPGTAATDDLALSGGVFGTSPPTVSAGDCKAAGAVTRYARFQVQLPESYESGETITLAISAGMLTTVADTACTIDVQAYKIDKAGGIGADVCATAAMTMNSLVFSTKSFVITPSGMVAGDVIDVRVAISCNDAATVAAVTPTIAAITLLADIR